MIKRYRGEGVTNSDNLALGKPLASWSIAAVRGCLIRDGP